MSDESNSDAVPQPVSEKSDFPLQEDPIPNVSPPVIPPPLPARLPLDPPETTLGFRTYAIALTVYVAVAHTKRNLVQKGIEELEELIDHVSRQDPEHSSWYEREYAEAKKVATEFLKEK